MKFFQEFSDDCIANSFVASSYLQRNNNRLSVQLEQTLRSNENARLASAKDLSDNLLYSKLLDAITITKRNTSITTATLLRFWDWNGRKLCDILYCGKQKRPATRTADNPTVLFSVCATFWPFWSMFTYPLCTLHKNLSYTSGFLPDRTRLKTSNNHLSTGSW